ncbi:MAG: thioredoxin family protein [bacterium]|nr:thioredoxin family protein [bacterium]
MIISLIAVVPAYADGAGNPDEPAVKIISEYKTVKAGVPFKIGILLNIPEGLHIYGKETDAGLPTAVEWEANGVTITEKPWPAETSFNDGSGKVLGYSGEVLLPYEAVCNVAGAGGGTDAGAGTAGGSSSESGGADAGAVGGVDADGGASASAGVGRVLLKAKVSWLMCGTSCMPGEAEAQLELPVTGEFVPSDDAGLFAGAQGTSAGVSPQAGTLPGQGGSVAGQDGSAAEQGGSAAEQGGSVSEQAPAQGRSGGTLPAGAQGILPGGCYGPPPHGQGLPDVAKASLGFLSSLLLAFLGGIILNFMPCVFPVLSLKILGFAKSEHHLRSALFYTLGILVSFWIVSGVLLALRAGGAKLGWGFQMQSPLFVALLFYLFLLIALNMLGVFETGLSLTRISADKWGSFGSGFVAVAAAAPCTAPFMGIALGAALVMPAWQSLLVFTSLALGMALPYILLSIFPGWLRFLPKSGRWLETFKQILAFPLLFTCVYFAWILIRSIGDDFSWVLAGAVTTGMAAWIYGRWPSRRIAWAFSVLLMAGAVAGAVIASSGNSSEVSGNSSEVRIAGSWEPWSPSRVQSELDAGRSVFVDFGADWCLTCQTNERLVLSNEKVLEQFGKKGVVLLKADWTDRNDAITEALASFGRSGVPLYVYYEPGRDPVVLPEVLTPQMVLDTIGE